MHQSFLNWVQLITLLIKRDLKVRYKSSVLGYIWSMLNPLLFMSVLTFVFTHAMRVQMDYYPLYILSGLLCWNIFAQSANLGALSLIDNASLLKKVSVPSWVFPTAVLGSAALHSCLAFLPFVLIALFMGFKFSICLVQLPLVLIIYFLFIEGVILVLGSLNVFFRDIAHVLEPVLQLIFYMSPILYPLSIIPEHYKFILLLNPMYYFLHAFRAGIYTHTWLSIIDWLTILGLSIISISAGLFVFHKSKNRILYYI
jgi:ABC-2 type transport system permease protein